MFLFLRGRPVEALKTALEGSPPKTRDERCKVFPFPFTFHFVLKDPRRKVLIFFLFVVSELDSGAQSADGNKRRGFIVLCFRS